MKTKKPNQPQIMTKEEFDRVNAAHHENIKRGCFGAEANRKANEELRRAWEKVEIYIKKGNKNEKND